MTRKQPSLAREALILNKLLRNQTTKTKEDQWY